MNPLFTTGNQPATTAASQLASKMTALGDSMRGYIWKITPETASMSQIELLEKQALCSVYDRMMKSSLLGPLPQETVTRFEKTKEKIALGLRVVADQQANDFERPDVRVPLILERTLTLLKKSGLTLDSTSLPVRQTFLGTRGDSVLLFQKWASSQ